MMISMIAAMANNRVIGKDNQMPWHLPADLAHFKKITLGKPVVMGRNTYESIGKALPGRHNIVITRNPDYQLPDATVVNSCEQALEVAGEVEEVMIIGGGAIYEAFLPSCKRLYLTLIDADIPGDTQFPDYQKAGAWQLVEEQQFLADSKNTFDLSFITISKEA